MKGLVSILALALALAFTGPAFAGASAAKTEADCTKAGGVWDAATNTCAEKKPQAVVRLFHGSEGRRLRPAPYSFEFGGFPSSNS